MFNNLWRDAGTELPALLGDTARVTEVNALAGSVQAARSIDGSHGIASLLAQETLPHVRNWVEAILYALFPVVVILMIVVSSEGAKKIISGYLMSLAWIGLWPVLFAVINHLSLMHLQYKARSLDLAHGIPFQMLDVFDATLVDEQAMLGYMVLFVPFISAALIRLGQGGFMSIADRMISGSLASASSTSGSAFASGNISLGQSGLDTAALNTTAMHKMDTNFTVFSGGATVGTASGGVMRLGANGASAFEQMQNRFLTSLSSSTRFDSMRSQEKHNTETSASGEHTLYRQTSSENSRLSNTHERAEGLSKNISKQSAHSLQSGSNEQTGYSEVMSHAYRQNSSFATTSGAHASGGFSLGGGLGLNIAHSASSPRLDSNRSLGHEISKEGKISTHLSGNVGLSANLGLSSQKTYSAAHTRNKSVDQVHSEEEHLRREDYDHESRSQSHQQTLSEQSSQNQRQAKERSHGESEDHSFSQDSAQRAEVGLSQRQHKNQSDLFTRHHEWLSDPDFMQAVAHRHGMSATRLYSQELVTIIDMASSYLEEQEIVAHAKNMNLNESLNQNDDFRHRLDSNRQDFSMEKLNTKDGHELLNSSVDRHLNDRLEPNRRALGEFDRQKISDFDRNIAAWASPDKKIGEGRANPMSVVEEIIARDIKDTGLKIFDKIKGGDGTLDKKMTNNEKNEIAPDFSIQKKD